MIGLTRTRKSYKVDVKRELDEMVDDSETCGRSSDDELKREMKMKTDDYGLSAVEEL